ncbi:Methionyl-tRNA formyltransferase [Escovopsis weberi]|uniref:Methionyl-tRNA formyltransferase n=1 Tax=Escovopsis weberi TaxID=150374 RepID=A0A0M9VUP2_ESCWE|nr:Methionyl-tRNA formyltransferase [Escovopsis weberi]
MVLPGKRTGRGLKEIREVPCKAVAQELGLTIHQRETFRNWDLPENINLIVVVSFGLFVPPRILRAAKSLRGPAPIHHALLRGDSHIGISLQTLHHKTFDHGTILAQTPPPGLPVPPSASIQQLTLALGAAGAQMLVQVLRDGVHVSPHSEAGWMASKLQARGEELDHAPKVSKEDAQMDWANWNGEAMRRRLRVFGMAWTRAASATKDEVKRVLFLNDNEPVEVRVGHDAKWSEGKMIFLQDSKGTEMHRHERMVRVDEKSGVVDILMADGTQTRVKTVKVDGKPEQAAATGLRPFIAFTKHEEGTAARKSK